MAPRPTGFDCHWLNMFKEGMSIRVRELVREDSEPSLSTMLAQGSIRRTITSVEVVPMGKEQTLNTCTCVYLVRVTGRCLSLTHLTLRLSESWLTWVLSVRAVLLAVSGTRRLRAMLRPQWAQVVTLPEGTSWSHCSALDPPCISMCCFSCLHTSRCLPRARPQGHQQSVNSERSVLI